MIKMLGTGLLAVGLAGCAAQPGANWWRDLAGLSAAPGAYRFDWRIAGEPALAPLQVFDDGRRTWLHYPPDQPAPAVFERTPRGDRLLRPHRQGDYLVLSGVPAHIVLRGGLLQADAWRPQAQDEGAGRVEWAADPMRAQAAADTAPGLESAGSVAPPASPSSLPPIAPVAPVARVASVAPAAPAAPVASVASIASIASVASGAPAAAGAPVAAITPKVPAMPAASAVPVAAAVPVPVSLAPLPHAAFEATPADGNIRRTLNRWARQAGWTFEAEHWAVDVDIPLAGSAVFDGPFLVAVRGLLAATELGDRPVQPCFYANQVLRVVPLAQRCDRTQVAGAAS